jgi:hypothetical protein
VIAIRPTRSADGAVGVTVDTASVLSLELCLPGSGGEVTSRDAMSALQEAGGNARWLLSRCPRCIADGSARRTSDPRAARGPGASGTRRDEFVRSRAVRRSCLGSPRRTISPYIVASSKILPGAVSGFDRTVTTAPRPRLRP